MLCDLYHLRGATWREDGGQNGFGAQRSGRGEESETVVLPPLFVVSEPSGNLKR